MTFFDWMSTYNYSGKTIGEIAYDAWSAGEEELRYKLANPNKPDDQNLKISETGRVSIDANVLANSPEFKRQVDAVKNACKLRSVIDNKHENRRTALWNDGDYTNTSLVSSPTKQESTPESKKKRVLVKDKILCLVKEGAYVYVNVLGTLRAPGLFEFTPSELEQFVNLVLEADLDNSTNELP